MRKVKAGKSAAKNSEVEIGIFAFVQQLECHRSGQECRADQLDGIDSGEAQQQEEAGEE
jgi:hypothetical protein